MPEPAETKQPAIDESKIGAAVAAGLDSKFDAILAALKPAEKTAAPKEWTDGEIDAAIAKGSISQAQGDALKRERDKKALKAEVLGEVRAEIDTRERSGSIASKAARYRELRPELQDPKSEISKRCAAAYAELRADGHPEGNLTALAAVRAVLGPLDALEAAAKPGRRETHEENSGGGGRGDGDDKAPPSMKGLSNKHREFYARQISKGIYRGWDDPMLVGEVEYIRARSKGVH